jgi:5-methylcytosine-specific restriction endonuclease McrA
MARFWTHHWQRRYWRHDVNRPGPVCSSGSNSFRKRGVSIGDTAYIISLSDGHLLLGGRMTIQRIVSRDEAVRFWGTKKLYPAEEWIIDPGKSGTRLDLRRRLAPELTRRLRFVSPQSGVRGLFFKSDTHLDGQATRGVQELTPESAALLDRIIDLTDRLPQSDEWITVTEDLLENGRSTGDQSSVRLPEEVPRGSTYSEGSVQRILVNRYERDPRARKECIEHYGTKYLLCGFDFVAIYGEAMTGFIHVHHLHPLSADEKDQEVDAIRDLRPVCPNCHAVLHRREPPYSLDDVRRFLESRRR